MNSNWKKKSTYS